MSGLGEATEDWKGAKSQDKIKEYTWLLSCPDFLEHSRHWESQESIIKGKVLQVQLRDIEYGIHLRQPSIGVKYSVALLVWG